MGEWQIELFDSNSNLLHVGFADGALTYQDAIKLALLEYGTGRFGVRGSIAGWARYYHTATLQTGQSNTIVVQNITITPRI